MQTGLLETWYLFEHPPRGDVQVEFLCRVLIRVDEVVTGAKDGVERNPNVNRYDPDHVEEWNTK